jgi:hypothetical protein
MNSKIESGINTYVGHFDQLTDICESFGSQYSPIPQNLHIVALRSQSIEVKRSIAAVDNALPIFAAAESARQERFSALPQRATRVQAVATVLGLPDAVLVLIREAVRKIRGQRARKIADVTPDDESQKHVSVSQRSFIEQIEHLSRLIALVSSQPAYIPSENDLTVPALNTLLNEMRATNSNAVTAEIPLTAARQERNRLLYTPKTGMMDTGLAVKEYVKAVFGASSQQYKQVRKITFKNKKRF